MVRELLLRLRLQGSSATEMRFKREGAGAAFKQQNGCVATPHRLQRRWCTQGTRCGGSEPIFGKNMDDDPRGDPLPNFKIQDKILQLYSIELVQVARSAKCRATATKPKKNVLLLLASTLRAATNLCGYGGGGWLFLLELKYCSEKFASFLHS